MVDRLVNSEANARRIALVENCFGNAGQPLSIKGRVLVGEGVLTKACRKRPKPRQYFLFNDVLVYGNILINKKKYNKQHIIPLEEVKLQSLEDEGVYKNGWLICTANKSFAVYAATATEKQEWMAHIDKCIRDLLNKTGKPPATEPAPVWVPDIEASLCMVCKKTKFSVIERRHHCRKCGAVVCASCSKGKFVLRKISSKPLRVCDGCYSVLSSSTNQVDEKAKLQKDAADLNDRNEAFSGSDDDSDDDENAEQPNQDVTVVDEPKFYPEK